MRHMTCAALALVATAVPAQVPAPPSLPGLEQMAERLRSAFRSRSLDDYAALLAKDVVVYEDGRQVAAGRASWLRRFGARFSAEGVMFELSPGFIGHDRLLFVEYFNSAASWGRTPPPDCCWRYDAVSYEVRSGQVVAIYRLLGGDRRLPAEPPGAGK